MPISRLDDRSALIVIDLQRGLSTAPTIHPLSDVALRVAVMADTFRMSGLPVAIVTADGVAPGRTEHEHPRGEFPPVFSEPMAELRTRPSDHRVVKRTWGAFTGTDLAQHLSSEGITQVVVSGVATRLGVESTARQAHELGFNVALAVDGMTDVSASAHRNSVEVIFPRLGETGTVQEIIDALMVRDGRR